MLKTGVKNREKNRVKIDQEKLERTATKNQTRDWNPHIERDQKAMETTPILESFLSIKKEHRLHISVETHGILIDQ